MINIIIIRWVVAQAVFLLIFPFPIQESGSFKKKKKKLTSISETNWKNNLAPSNLSSKII